MHIKLTAQDLSIGLATSMQQLAHLQMLF